MCDRFCRLLIVSCDILALFSYGNIQFSAVKEFSTIICLLSMWWCVAALYRILMLYKDQNDQNFPQIRASLNSSSKHSTSLRGLEWLCIAPGFLIWFTWLLTLGWDLSLRHDGSRFFSLGRVQVERLETIVSNLSLSPALVNMFRELINMLHIDDISVHAAVEALSAMSIITIVCWMQLIKVAFMLHNTIQDHGKNATGRFDHKIRICTGAAIVISTIAFIIIGFCRFEEFLELLLHHEPLRLFECRPGTLLGFMNHLRLPLVAVAISVAAFTARYISKFVQARQTMHGTSNIDEITMDRMNTSFRSLQLLVICCATILAAVSSSLTKGVYLGLMCAMLVPGNYSHYVANLVELM